MLDHNLDGSPKEGATQVRGQDGKFVSGKAKAAAGQPGQVAETPAETARKLKLQLDGQEVEMDESEVVSEAQKSKFAQAQASKLAKDLDLTRREKDKVAEALKAAMTDDAALERVLRALGRDPEKLAFDILGKKMQAQITADEEAKLSPEARELKQLRAERDAAKRADEEKAKAAKGAEHQAAVAKHVELIGNGIKMGLKDTAFEGNVFAERLFFDQVQNFVRLVEDGAIHPKTGKAWTVEDFPSPKEIGAWLEEDISAAIAAVAKKNPNTARKHLTKEVLELLVATAEEGAAVHPDSKPNSPGAKEVEVDDDAPKAVGHIRRPKKVKPDAMYNNPADLAEALFKAKAKKQGGPRGLQRLGS
jgi:hypothetical protein